MAINSYDIVSTLQALGMMKYWKGKHIILKKQVRTYRLSCDRGPQPLQVATRATGISDFRDTWMQINPTQGKQNLFLPFFVSSFIFYYPPSSFSLIALMVLFFCCSFWHASFPFLSVLSFSHSSFTYSFACAVLYASFPAVMFLSVYRAYCLYLSVSILGKFS